MLTETDADALAALLTPRPSGSLFGPVIDLRQTSAKLQAPTKPLFDQPRLRVPATPAPTSSKAIFERSKSAVAPDSSAQAAGAVRPRLAVQMGDAVPVGFVPAGEASSRAPSRRWLLALALLVVGGLVGLMFTLGGDAGEVDADGGPSSSRSAVSTVGVSTTRPDTTAVPTTSLPTPTVPTTAVPTSAVPMTAATAPSTVAPAVAPPAPPTTARRTTTTARRTSGTTAAPTTVVQSAPQTTVTFAPPTWSVTPAPTTAPTAPPPSSTPATTAPPTSPPVTSSPPSTSAATSAPQGSARGPAE